MDEGTRVRPERWLLLVGILTAVVFSARWVFLAGTQGAGEAVVVYCALDREFAEPVLADFTRKTGIRVDAKYDVESTKTVGLVQAILAEAGRPRCDVFWNNEVLHTLRLASKGLLAEYQPPNAERFPAQFRDPRGRWHGFAARARVLLVHRDAAKGADAPRSILDLADDRWKGKGAIAKPLFGTTATHAACLFAAWGDERAEDFFRRLKDNGVQVLSGNKQVAQAVAAGHVAFGLTDTDDAIIEVESGQPVEIVYPDQGADGIGALFIPNTVAILAGAPHPAAARKLVDYLLTPAVEERLAKGASAQIPLSLDADAAVRVQTPKTVKAMEVDFQKAAEAWERAARYLEGEFGEVK